MFSAEQEIIMGVSFGKLVFCLISYPKLSDLENSLFDYVIMIDRSLDVDVEIV